MYLSLRVITMRYLTLLPVCDKNVPVTYPAKIKKRPVRFFAHTLACNNTSFSVSIISFFLSMALAGASIILIVYLQIDSSFRSVVPFSSPAGKRLWHVKQAITFQLLLCHVTSCALWAWVINSLNDNCHHFKKDDVRPLLLAWLGMCYIGWLPAAFAFISTSFYSL